MYFFPLYIELPSPIVVVTSNGNANLGLRLFLTCSVSVIEGLVVKPNIYWTKVTVDDQSANQIDKSLITVNGSVSRIALRFLQASDSGNYTCISEISIEEISIEIMNTSSTVVELKSIQNVIL